MKLRDETVVVVKGRMARKKRPRETRGGEFFMVPEEDFKPFARLGGGAE